jgi:hypothetical protein
MICSEVSCFISDICNVCSLVFIFVTFPRGLSILLILRRTVIFSLIFLFFPYLKFCWFLLLSLFVSFLYYYPCLYLHCVIQELSVCSLCHLYTLEQYIWILFTIILFSSPTSLSPANSSTIYIYMHVYDQIFICVHIYLYLSCLNSTFEEEHPLCFWTWFILLIWGSSVLSIYLQKSYFHSSLYLNTALYIYTGVWTQGFTFVKLEFHFLSPVSIFYAMFLSISLCIVFLAVALNIWYIKFITIYWYWLYQYFTLCKCRNLTSLDSFYELHNWINIVLRISFTDIQYHIR